jgi:putative membrane protein
MDEHLTPDQLWSAWTWEPWFLLPLALAVMIYVVGMSNIWRRAGAGRGIHAGRVVSFLGAVLALLVIFVSPLDALSEELFSAHMVQHMLLIFIVAPLLVCSDFPLALLWALPRNWAQSLGHKWNQSPIPSRVWQVLTSPVSAWVQFTIVFWIWHASWLYEAALQNEVIHILEHVLFLATGILFWWVLFQPTEQKHRRYGIGVLYLFTTVLQSGILGALMTFASQPWYSSYAGSVRHWGLTSLQDQQLAGIIMWMIGGAVFTLLTIGYFAAWLRAVEHHSARLQPRKVIPRSHEIS